MLIIGCDFHSAFQQIAIFDNQTGEIEEKKLLHPGEAAEFYRRLREQGVRAEVAMESGVGCQWFRRLLDSCGHRLRVGDARRIRAAEVRRQKTDRRDAELILRLAMEGRFPDIWVPCEQERDARQLLMDRHHRMRVQVKCKNQLHALAMNQGVKLGRRLWTADGLEQLRRLEMGEYAGQRRDAALRLVEQLESELRELDGRIIAEASSRADARRLMTHPGVGEQTALATVLTMGDVRRFQTSRQWVSYLGLAPTEHSSGGRQRLGHISKQGSSLMRFLLVQAGQTAARLDAGLKRDYQRLSARKHRALAKVMVARKLAVRLYWMLRNNWTYAELARHAGKPGSSCGE